jgi:hypothetical protein
VQPNFLLINYSLYKLDHGFFDPSLTHIHNFSFLKPKHSSDHDNEKDHEEGCIWITSTNCVVVRDDRRLRIWEFDAKKVELINERTIIETKRIKSINRRLAYLGRNVAILPNGAILLMIYHSGLGELLMYDHKTDQLTSLMQSSINKQIKNFFLYKNGEIVLIISDPNKKPRIPEADFEIHHFPEVMCLYQQAEAPEVKKESDAERPRAFQKR